MGKSIRRRSLKDGPARRNPVLEPVSNRALHIMSISLRYAPPKRAIGAEFSGKLLKRWIAFYDLLNLLGEFGPAEDLEPWEGLRDRILVLVRVGRNDQRYPRYTEHSECRTSERPPIQHTHAHWARTTIAQPVLADHAAFLNSSRYAKFGSAPSSTQSTP